MNTFLHWPDMYTHTHTKDVNLFRYRRCVSLLSKRSDTGIRLLQTRKPEKTKHGSLLFWWTESRLCLCNRDTLAFPCHGDYLLNFPDIWMPIKHVHKPTQSKAALSLVLPFSTRPDAPPFAHLCGGDFFPPPRSVYSAETGNFIRIWQSEERKPRRQMWGQE